MHLLIVSDTYLPSRTSAAVLLYELAQTFLNQGIQVVILVPSSMQQERIKFELHEGCKVISVKALKIKDISYIRRTINEFINPWIMWSTLRGCAEFKSIPIAGVIWYSPSIFWGPLIKRLKNLFKCRSYLILRDIFPDWALHLSILKRGVTYSFFKAVERYQYLQADTIGLQSPNSLAYFNNSHQKIQARLETLWNWARPVTSIKNKICSIDVASTHLQGRVIFVYAGNLGVAQGVELLMEMVKKLNAYKEIGFLIVGRGSELSAFREFAKLEGLENIIIRDEIDPFEIPSLYDQCDVGMLFLDRRHQTHNIPGKFITYLQAGLPVIAVVNPGNDIENLISKYDLGFSYSGEDSELLCQQAVKIANDIILGKDFEEQCKALVSQVFNSKIIASQIVKALKN